MSNLEETKRKAEEAGRRDARLGLTRNSRALAGSLWDTYYNRGYDNA